MNFPDYSNALYLIATNIGKGINISNILSITNQVELSTNSESWTNGLTLEQLTNNAVHNSNELYLTIQPGGGIYQLIMSATNQITLLNPGILNLISSIETDYSGDFGADPSFSGEYDIDLGHGIIIAMGTRVPSFGGIRSIIAWACVLSLFYFNWRAFAAAVSSILQTPQATTAGTSVLGTNVNSPSALAMAGLIIVTASALVPLAVAYMSGEISTFMSIHQFLYWGVQLLLVVLFMVSSTSMFLFLRSWLALILGLYFW